MSLLKQWKRRSVALVTTLLVGALLPASAYAAATETESVLEGAETKIVRVAFPTQEGMSFFGHSGKVTGYNYDYLEKISEYTGWEMEYVPYASADGNEAVGSAINDLMEGNVDLLGPLLKNEATEELFDFPEHSYGTVYTTLCALSASNLRENNLHQQDLIKVGLWEKAEVRNSEVIAYLDSENLSYEITYYDSAEAQQQALIDGSVDAISSVSLSPISNSRIIAQFAARPYYFATTKGNKEFIDQLDATIVKINKAESKLQDNLYDKYFRNIDDVFLLSDEQEEALQQMDTLKVLCIAHDAPYVYQRDGEPAGMLISILEDYAEKVGVSLDYTFCENREEAENLLQQDSYDIFIGLPLTSTDCAKLGYINSVPVIESILAYVNNPSGAQGDRIALVRGLEEQIDTSDYSETQIYDSISECLDAVSSGKVDIAAGDRSGLVYYIYDSGSTLTTSQIPGQTQNVAIAVSRDSDEELLNSLNNYIYSISEADLATYLSDGNIHSDAFSLTFYIRRHPVQFTLIIVSITLLIAFLIFFLLGRSNRQKAAMQKQHNEQLQEALQIAREANQSKTTFLSNMSHDIRTPMNAVLGFSTLLAKEPGNETKVREYARKITAAGNHLLGLINDILDISKIESGKVTLHQSVFSLDELLESINVVIRPMAGAKRQSFQINVGTIEHELFVGDKVRINQILINLLSNAVKYTPVDGHIEFNIKDLGNSSTSFVSMQFQVKDDGYGITEDFKKIIFDPFTRSESSTINKEVGTGLGLAITKNIIDLMGGTIELDSTIGKGSTFTVELPLRIPHEEEDEHFWEHHGISRILLVDDDKSVCDGIKESMSDSGVEFDAVYSGESAVELVKKVYEAHQEYSAIVLDWQMPGMNGLDTAREIRKIIPMDTPVLFLTSYDWSEIETEALEIDVDGFLSKPFTEVNLKEKLIEVEHFKNAIAETSIDLDMHGMHFLVAEDNQLNIEIISAILESEGATCDIAENGQIAEDKFVSAPSHTYDAILMDVMMPILNGYDATRMIRSSGHPEAQSIPIIAMTANAFVKDVQDALDAGMNAHIAKPINMETLKNTLGWCIRK